MFVLDLFNNDHERRLAEGAVDQLEQRRIDDLAMKMDDLVARAKNPAYKKNPAALAALMKEFQKCKAERDSYYKIRNETMGYGGLTSEENVNEGAMKDMLWDLSNRMDRDQFIDYTTSEMGQDADEMAQFWDNIHGPLDEAGLPTPPPSRPTVGRQPTVASVDLDNPQARLDPQTINTINRSVAGQSDAQLSRHAVKTGLHPKVKSAVDAEIARRAKTADSGMDEAGIPGNIPTEKIPGKEDLLKGKGRSYYESQKKKSDPVDEGQVSDEVSHRGDVDTKANIEVLGVDLANDTFKITYNGKPYTIKIQNFSQEDLGRWQIADYDVDIINSKGKKVRIDWDKDRQVTMVNTIIAYLDTQQAGDIQYMAWRQVGLENSTAEDLYQEIQDFYQNDQQKIDKTTAWLAQNMEDTNQRQVFADYVKNPVSRPARTKYIPKEYLMYVAFSYSREGNTELTPGMNLKPIQLTDPDDEEEFYRKVDELFKKVQFKFDAFENKIVELGDSYGLGSDPDLGSGFGQREIVWDHKQMTTSSSESNLNRQQIIAKAILNFQAELKKYVESFNNTLIKIGLPGIGEYSTWSGVLGDQLTDQQVRYFDTPEGFANLATGKVDLAKMLDDNVEKLGLKETGNPTLGEKKLGQLRPSLGTGHDIGRSIKKFRTQRGLDEYISMGSDKNYQEAEPYKNYRIYVRKKPFGTTGMYTAHTEIDRKEFMGKGASQEEAVQAIQDRIDFVLNAQRKVTGSSTIDFNVKFATDLLADPRQTFYAKLENINGEPKLVIASADVASDPELLAAGDFKRSALRNQPDEQGSATPLPGIPLTAKGLRSGDWIANGRYTVGNETQDRDGNRVFDLTYHSTAHTKSDKLRLNQPAFTLGTAREVDEHGGGIGPRQHWQDLMQERKLAPGDPVIVTAPNEFEGKTGEIYDFAPSGKFVIVNLYNHGKHSMHLSDVEYNQYADDREQDDWYDEGVAEGWSDAMVARRTGQPRTPYSVYIKGKKWKDFENDDHAEAVANKLRAKFKAEGRDPGVITIAPTDMNEAIVASGPSKPLDDRAVRKMVWDTMKINADSGEQALQRALAVLAKKPQSRMVQDLQDKFQSLADRLSQRVAETVVDVKSGMARIYRQLAPRIERHRDSFLAGQLYDELENYAELHGAEAEFKRMMNSARNRAHMDYDTNPGGFQNWFWYLPFAEEELSEEQDTSGVERAILNRIMVAHTDLLMKFGPEKVMQAAEEVAYNVGDVDEIGTSDVSAYVHQVKQILGVPEEVNEKWSQKYKSSINCASPKGFSQKAHCAGKKK